MPQAAQPAILELRADYPRVPPKALVYAIGDVHGCADQLERMHKEIVKDSRRSKAERKVAIYLGDYIDRGPDSKRVVDLVTQQPLEGFERVHLIGNHEAFLLEFMIDIEAGPGWFFNGGISTLASYGIKVDKDEDFDFDMLVQLQDELLRKIPEKHLDFYRQLAFTHQEGDYFFVHAGIRPGIPFDNQSDEDMLWIRDEFLHSDADYGKVVVHGHTIAWEPERRPNRIGIDTGCFASGVLTALVLDGREQDFITVMGAV